MIRKHWKSVAAVGAVVVLAAVALIIGLAGRRTGGEAYALITVNGKEYASVPLSAAPRDILVDQGNGTVNLIRVDNDGVSMQSSSCDNQLCVRSGKVTLENRFLRPEQEYIICLPNSVAVQLVTLGGSGAAGR